MLFNSLPFAIFFLALFAILRASPRRFEAGVLLAASLVFYAMWYPVYLLLLLGTIAINHLLLRGMLARGNSRAYLVASIVFTLSLLGWYKYAGMAIETLLPVLEGGLGLAVPVPEPFLPLGISFYSFQIIAFAVDLHRRHIEELPSLPRFVLFISFFPQLIAGPIVRGRELLPQLEAGSARSPEFTRAGIWLICSGLLKKVLMGDFLLAGFVNEVFAHPGTAGAGVHLVAAYAFAFQIYFDFSGYTDMARGLGLLLGYELPLNFEEPYLSLNPNEFWRRWHISLSQWFRDYVYIPLGGNRSGSGRTYFNLAITLVLSGLWHGANWTFVVWGAYHAVFLTAHRFCAPWLARLRPEGVSTARAWTFVCWLTTFHAVVVGFVIFRAASIHDALTLFEAIFRKSYAAGLPPLETLLIFAGLAFHLAERWIRDHRATLQQRLRVSRWGTLAEGIAIGAIAAITLATSGSGGEFIYFQF